MGTTTKEGVIKTLSFITLILIIIGTATYFKFKYHSSGGIMQYIVGDDTKPRHSLVITEDWSKSIPINVNSYLREDETWVEVCVVGGGTNGDFIYDVPPKSMRGNDWRPPELKGISLRYRLAPGKNKVKSAEIFYVMK